MAKSLLIFNESDEAKKRQYVLDFYERFGEEATKKAFRSLVNVGINIVRGFR